MHQHRDRLAVSVDSGDRAVRPRRRQHERAPGRIDVAAIEPVANLEAGIAERVGERVAESAGARWPRSTTRSVTFARAHGSVSSPSRARRRAPERALVHEQRRVLHRRGLGGEPRERVPRQHGDEEPRGPERGEPLPALPAERSDVAMARDEHEQRAQRERRDFARPDRLERARRRIRSPRPRDRAVAQASGRIRQDEVDQRPAVQVQELVAGEVGGEPREPVAASSAPAPAARDAAPSRRARMRSASSRSRGRAATRPDRPSRSTPAPRRARRPRRPAIATSRSARTALSRRAPRAPRPRALASG